MELTYSLPVISHSQVFDILPLYGMLKPGETEQITLSFYGHANIMCNTKALCEVEGGQIGRASCRERV